MLSLFPGSIIMAVFAFENPVHTYVCGVPLCVCVYYACVWVCVCVCVCVCTRYCVHVEEREHLVKASSRLLPCGLQESNSDHQTWWQML